MKPKLIAIFLFLVLLPLALLAGLGITLARGESRMLETQVQQLLTGQLQEIHAQLSRFLQTRERQLAEETAQAPDDPEELRALGRQIPWVRQMFVLQPDGTLQYPSPQAELTDREWDFLERTREIWQRGELAAASAASLSNQMQAPSQIKLSQWMDDGPQRPVSGWHTWYWGSGLHLIYWQLREDGRLIGAELDRVRFLADLIGQLPATAPNPAGEAEARIQLRDSNGALLYQWGNFTPPEGAMPVASLALPHPLGSWRLDSFVPATLLTAGRGSLLFSLIAGLTVTGLLLIGFAVYFYRESSREFREASRRVSFVNQVSHELKTPLTNIRLYAELLQDQLSEHPDGVDRHVGIIVSECERLSRLIGNVLTFSRSRRQALTLHKTPLRVEEVIRRVIDRFEPGLTRQSIRLHYEAGEAPPVSAAGDALEQILGNLINNVEKYAAAGGEATITSSYEHGRTVITVSDRGPGIAPEDREKIFQPFYRVSSALTEGVSGAGIGLAIARELARLHGGDLTLQPLENGTCFKVELNTPSMESEAAACAS